jgi:2-(1,2-epoxy-1,2-dihydrophenyl)acetyl-CoA isomerase
VTLSRPALANAIDLPMAHDLRAAVRRLIADDQVHVLLLEGEGRHFCGGGDVQAMAAEPAAWAGRVAESFHEAVLELHESPKAIVAGVQGAVAGGGMSLALGADIVIASPTTRFTAAWATIGLTPDGGASWLLPRIVGMRRATSMLAGQEVSGTTALDWGLVSEVVEEHEVRDRARAVAASIATGAWRALGASNRLLRTSWDCSLPQRLDEEVVSIDLLRQDNQVVLEAFVDRRTMH